MYRKRRDEEHEDNLADELGGIAKIAGELKDNNGEGQLEKANKKEFQKEIGAIPDSSLSIAEPFHAKYVEGRGRVVTSGGMSARESEYYGDQD